MSSTIFLGGNLALRYSRNTRLLRRRRVLVGAFSVAFPIRSYLGLRAGKQQDDIGEAHPAYEAWGWTVAMFADTNISNSIQKLRHHDVPSEYLEAYQKIEKRFLDCETRGECLPSSLVTPYSNLTTYHCFQVSFLVYSIALVSCGHPQSKD